MKKRYPLVFAAAFVLSCLVWRGFGAVKYFTDKPVLYTARLTAGDFEKTALVEKEGWYVATDNDPYMTITLDCRVKKLEIEIEYYATPGELLVLYTKGEGQEFSFKNYALAGRGENGVYTVDLGGENVHRLRIDPTVVGGNKMKIGNVYINRDVTISDYINFAPVNLFWAFSSSALLSAGAMFVLEIREKKLQL